MIILFYPRGGIKSNAGRGRISFLSHFLRLLPFFPLLPPLLFIPRDISDHAIDSIAGGRRNAVYAASSAFRIACVMEGRVVDGPRRKGKKDEKKGAKTERRKRE